MSVKEKYDKVRENTSALTVEVKRLQWTTVQVQQKARLPLAHSRRYHLPLITKDKRIVVAAAYSLPVIKSTISEDKETIKTLFPDFQGDNLVRES